MGQERQGSALGIAGGLAVIYLVWGSTYLAMQVTIQTMPPFVTGGVRFVIAGVVLWGWARAAGVGRPSGRQWRNAAVVGLLFFLGGNGAVGWAMDVERVPSGLAALTVATTPAWMVLMDWGWGGPRPRPRVGVGIGVGLVGVAVLVGTDGEAGVSLPGAAALTTASVAWAAGSIVARRADLPRSPALTTGMEMLAGGVALAALGAAAGEGSRLDLGRVSGESGAAFVYLVAAAVVALCVYTWLLTVADPGLVGTYAFVNPVVAVALGAAVADEPLTRKAGVAAALVVVGVALIAWPRRTAGRA